ncbi:MAG: hypothetical protein ACRD2R_05970 [Terriglobales bacterium]
MIEELRNQLWTRMRNRLHPDTRREDLLFMKIAGEADHTVLLYVFERVRSEPTFCVRTVRNNAQAARLHREFAELLEKQQQPGESAFDAAVMLDVEGYPAVISDPAALDRQSGWNWK